MAWGEVGADVWLVPDVPWSVPSPNTLERCLQTPDKSKAFPWDVCVSTEPHPGDRGQAGSPKHARAHSTPGRPDPTELEAIGLGPAPGEEGMSPGGLERWHRAASAEA